MNVFVYERVLLKFFYSELNCNILHLLYYLNKQFYPSTRSNVENVYSCCGYKIQIVNNCRERLLCNYQNISFFMFVAVEW